MNRIEPVFNRLVRMEASEANEITIHQHFGYEIIYLLSGTYEYSHNDIRKRLKKHQGVLIRPGDWHADHLRKGCVYMAVNFSLNEEAGHETLKHDANINHLVFDDSEHIIFELMKRITQEQNIADSFSHNLLDIYTLELFWSVLRLLPEPILNTKTTGENERESFKSELTRIFQDNLLLSPSLEDLATKMHLTPRTLQNKCGEYFGISPVKAFMRYKMEHAYDLLRKTDMSIKEISEYLGFQNPYHFSKVFKRYYMRAPHFSRKKR